MQEDTAEVYVECDIATEKKFEEVESEVEETVEVEFVDIPVEDVPIKEYILYLALLGMDLS